MSQQLESPSPNSMSLDRGPAWAYEAYNEEAFRHFLGIERQRAEQAGRSLLLLLVDVTREGEPDGRIASVIATKVFSALAACVREVDFIGWYRTHQVAGAVLTQGHETPSPDVSHQVAARVGEALADRLPSHLTGSVQVRLLQLRPSATN